MACGIALALIGTPSRPSGDDGSGAGLPVAPAHGLSHGAAPADAGVLDEGEEPEAQVLSHRQHPGQAAPQRRLPQDGDQQLLGVSHQSELKDFCVLLAEWKVLVHDGGVETFVDVLAEVDLAAVTAQTVCWGVSRCF